jgi:hypothetical protein
MKHEQTWTQKTHHGPNLGETTTFPLIVYYVPFHKFKPTSKWHFVLGLPNESPEIPKVGTPTTLGPHNFVWKPHIEMRSRENL